MKGLLTSLLFGNRRLIQATSILLFLHALNTSAQIANYVTNGGFEAKYNCNYPNELNKAKGWNCVGDDTAKFGGFLYAVDCFSNAPYTGGGFQYPRSGSTLYRMPVFCTNPCPSINSRIYPKNRLKSTLSAGKTYCVKMYVSLQNTAPTAISNIGFYFSDGSIDTIKYANQPLSYLYPQITNSSNNIITDTLGWVQVGGTFTAVGNEKYLVLGNFETDAATTQTQVAPGFTIIGTEYFVDDISCIDIDLPAFAGRDTSVVTGNTVYIGRSSDVGIDEACTWFRLPDMNTVLATSAGITVTANGISTYVVRQEICGNVKWDTVVVRENPLALNMLDQNADSYRIYPQPARGEINIEGNEVSVPIHLEIYNTQGGLILHKDYPIFPGLINLPISLKSGLYFIKLCSGGDTFASKLLFSD